MDLSTLTEGTPNTKPWLNIVAKSVTTSTMAADNFEIKNMKVDGDLKVAGYAGSLAENMASIFISTSNASVATPAGTGGSTFSYAGGKLVVSSLTGTNTLIYTTDGGATWTQPTLPAGIAVPAACWSPALNLWVLIDATASAIYTSPTMVTGSFTTQTPLTGTFGSGKIRYLPALNKMMAISADANNYVMFSPDGLSWTKVPSTRDVFDYAYSEKLKVLVTVGSNGPAYSLDDGKSFVNASSVASMSSVTWSAYHGVFLATPRNGTLTTVYASSDGINWVARPNAFPSTVGNVRGIIWIPSFMLYVAVGDGDAFYLSQDGVTFRRPRSLGTTSGSYSFYGVAYIEEWGQLFMNGIGGAIRLTPRRWV